jgi:hypothetical protein
MGRTILIDSGMGKSFWGFAFIWACDILNTLPNKRTGSITPFEAFYGFKPPMDRHRIFGEKGFIHVPEEKRKKLDERGLEGRVVAHCDDSKGWIFLLTGTNELVGAAVVEWPDQKPVFVKKVDPEKTQTAESTSPTTNDKTGVEQSVRSENNHPQGKSSPKHGISFIVNQMELGNFTDKTTFQSQELMIDRILLECEFFAVSVPKTYKQAQKSVAWTNWKAVVAKELENLDSMKVWTVKKVPPGRKPLKG